MSNLYAEFAAVASVAVSEPTANDGADGKPSADAVAAAQAAVVAVREAFLSL